jgi:chromosome partitioning protein
MHTITSSCRRRHEYDIQGCESAILKHDPFLNRADPAGPDNDDAAAVLRDATELAFVETPIVARKAFGKAAAQGLAVIELKPPDEKAIQEMQALCDLVFQNHRTSKWSGHAR